MRRILIIALVLLMASAASAQWYLGVKLAGTADDEVLFEGWYWDRDMLSGDNDGIIDNSQIILGYGLDAMDVELSLGYSKETLKYDDPSGGRYDEEMNYSKYVLGLTGFYHLTGNETVALDAGLRFQLEGETWDYEESMSRYKWEDKLSGWAAGPVFRGRWYLGDGGLALGPEVFFKYTSKTYEEDYDSSRADYELDVSGMGFEYALRLDFMF